MSADERDAFLTSGALFAKIGTTNAEGWPMVSPVWYEWDGERAWVFTTPDTGKVQRIRVNPRVGRSGNLVFALFAFVVYFNLLNLGQSWIYRGRVGLGTFMLLLHGGTLLAGLLWLAKQHNNWAWPSMLRLRRKEAAAQA